MRFPRIRRLGAWLASGLAGFLFLVFLRITGTSLPGTGPQLPPEPEPTSLLTYTESDTVHRGDTFSGLLLRNGLEITEIEQVLRELREHQYFSPRALVPRQVIEFTRNEERDLQRVTFRVSPTEIYVFEMHPTDGLASYAQSVDSEVKVRKLAGTIQSTFEEAVLAAGGNPRLVSNFADVLSCDIDFCTEVRKGDRFGVLVEERYVEGKFIGYGNILYGWYKGDEASASAVYFTGSGTRGGFYDMQGKSLRRGFLKSPLNFTRVSSFFTQKRFHPILRLFRPHHGVDYAAPEGTPVVAVADGVVAFAGFRGGYGRLVDIKHDRSYETRYGHLCRFAPGIHAGTRVKQGDRIGFVGHTGLATGNHLHYEVVEAGRLIDPLRIKSFPTDPIPSAQMDQFRKLAQEIASVDEQLADGALVEPASWKSLFAQNAAVATGPTLH